MSPTRQYYDTTRMPACLLENLARPLPELLGKIVGDARSFSGGREFEDDLCLLAVEIRRTGPPAA